MSHVLILASAAAEPRQSTNDVSWPYPRVDYLELARLLDARVKILDYSAYERLRAHESLRRLETHLRSDVVLAWLGLRAARNCDLVFSMSERVGTPYAGLCKLFGLRRPFVFLFTAWSARQRAVIGRLNLLSTADKVLVESIPLGELLCRELGLPEAKVQYVSYAVDQDFFTPSSAPDSSMILSVGEVRGRDYATLIRAAEDIDAEVHIAASGRWYAREKKARFDAQMPSNVSVGGRYPIAKLRDLYAQARFVVVPLRDEVFSAGVTVALEAMAMGKAVIVSRSRGLMDYVVDGETALVVPLEDPAALRGAMQYLLSHPDEARRLGENGRLMVEERFSLDKYCERLAGILLETLNEAQ